MHWIFERLTMLSQQDGNRLRKESDLEGKIAFRSRGFYLILRENGLFLLPLEHFSFPKVSFPAYSLKEKVKRVQE